MCVCVCVWLQFLTFFFTNLTTWIQEEWNNIYDAAYVEKHWIDPLLRWEKHRKMFWFFLGSDCWNESVYLSFRWRPEIDSLMDQLAVKISRGSQAKRAPIKTTKPQEFSLTRPKPPPLPAPELIPQQEKCKPVSLIHCYSRYFLQTLPRSRLYIVLGAPLKRNLFYRCQTALTGLRKRCRW